jgi:hypothetical protein
MMRDKPRAFHRLLCGAVALLLTACAGIDLASVQRADASQAQASSQASIAVGKVRFIVDGQPLAYHFLNRPALQLYHRGRGQRMSTPVTAVDGRFAWKLPPGDYGVAVIFGGKVPSQQPHLLPGGGLVFVNGIVDPGLEFSLTPDSVSYLGTLVVDVESAPQQGVLFGKERVFGKLLAIRVEDEFDAEQARGVPPSTRPVLMRRIERNRTTAYRSLR